MIAPAGFAHSKNGHLDYDIIVVGGGPGGCAFVRSLLRFKVRARVLLIDKERFPRDKVCGDGLNHRAVPMVAEVFPELPSLIPSESFTERQIFCYPGAAPMQRRELTLDVMPRVEFDNALWQATVAAGAETLEQAQVTGLLFENGRVRGVKLREGETERELTCSLVVGADGSRSIVRRATGPTDRDHVIYALRQYVRDIPETTNGLVFSFDTENLGYFWLFPFVRNGERWANIGYGNTSNPQILKKRFHHYCRSAEMREYIGNARFEGNLIGFPLNMAKFKWNGRFARRLWGPGYLLLGDAASLIHPFTGEGIGYAIESGRLAAEVLADARIPADRKGAVYERRVTRRMRGSFFSPAVFCAVVLPALLPRPLSKALVASAVFAQRHFGFGLRPIFRTHSKKAVR
ncbi:MAG: geranylgeranyl reductase family protein [Verrucomicrobiota bacterium]